MRSIKWDRVKQEALDLVSGAMHPDTGHQAGGIFFNPLNRGLPYSALVEAAREGRQVNEVILADRQGVMNKIRNWDIRRAQALIDLFADKGHRIGPRKINRIEHNEHGDWVLIY